MVWNVGWWLFYVWFENWCLIIFFSIWLVVLVLGKVYILWYFFLLCILLFWLCCEYSCYFFFFGYGSVYLGYGIVVRFRSCCFWCLFFVISIFCIDRCFVWDIVCCMVSIWFECWLLFCDYSCWFWNDCCVIVVFYVKVSNLRCLL